MLDGQEERLVVGREDRPTDFRTGRRLIEEPGQRAAEARRIGGIDTIGNARRAGRAVGHDQMRPLLSKAMLSGQDSQPLSLVAR